MSKETESLANTPGKDFEIFSIFIAVLIFKKFWGHVLWPQNYINK